MNFFLAISFWYIYQKNHVDASQDVCVYIDHHDKRVNVTKIGCPDNDICKKTFNISSVNILPYSYYKPIPWLIKRCCGSCAKYRYVNRFANISEVSPSSINSSDFVFPFLATKSTHKLYGKYFIPYWDAPYAFYITREEHTNVLKSMFVLYPLVLIALLLGVISGFIVWIMDTWYNKQEFPRQFFIGWFEGFWWSFVSMTTVGYGDKTPKSIHARLFAVLWILIGIITFGLLTASLTTEIMNVNSPPPPDMSGALVGALRYRSYDALIIAKHHGLVKYTKKNTKVFHDAFFELITMLQKKEIEGFLLDKYTLQFVTLVMLKKNLNNKTRNKYRHQIEFFKHSTTKTIKTYDGQYRLSYGILVKGLENYEYFSSVLEGNQLHHEMARSLRGNIRKQNITTENSGLFYSKSHSLFSPDGHYFQHTLKVGFGIVGAICIFGIFHEIHRKWFAGKLCKSQNTDESQNDNTIQ